MHFHCTSKPCVLEPFLTLTLRPSGADMGRRNPHLLRGGHIDFDLRPVAQPQEHGGSLDRRDVELADLARLAITLPLKRRKRQVFGDLVQTQVATP